MKHGFYKRQCHITGKEESQKNNSYCDLQALFPFLFTVSAILNPFFYSCFEYLLQWKLSNFLKSARSDTNEKKGENGAQIIALYTENGFFSSQHGSSQWEKKY